MPTKKPAHVSQEKKKVVVELKKMIKQYPLFGIINLENLPSPQLQKMRKQLREKVTILTAKKSLIMLALEDLKKEISGCEQLLPYLKGMPAILFARENPFKIYNLLKKSKSKAPAKAGQIAPTNIVINKGPTPFTPGPIIGELGKLGIKSSVEEGKVVINEDTVVAKEGEALNANVVTLLANLKIEPMEIGLNLSCIYEKGMVYGKDILDIDEVAFGKKLRSAIAEAFNVSVFSAYPTRENRKVLIQKAYKDSTALALAAGILEKDVIGMILAKAEAQAQHIQSKVR